MSRIGRLPITIPQDVTVSLEDHQVRVKGPKGELVQAIPASIKVNLDGKTLAVTRQGDQGSIPALHGTIRAILANMIIGVTQGYEKRLELVGTGYRVAKQGDKLVLNLGFSHHLEVLAQPGLTFEVEGNTKISVKGIDKQSVGQVAADIRRLKPPEPYKGKGIRYQNELVRRKAGKAAKVGQAAGA